MATTAITSLFGFAYWWLAARTAPAEAVGQASAAVSAMTLIGTIGMFGMGTMLISDLPKLAGRKWELISTCLLVSGGAATLGGLVYVALAHLAIPGLQNALGSTAATVLLVFGIALNAMTLVLDEALVGLLAGPDAADAQRLVLGDQAGPARRRSRCCRSPSPAATCC